MRIILVQAEIELAIRNYVLNQIAVKDGQDITIDFKNTRGEDGATAEINISAPQQGQQTGSQNTSAPSTKSAPSVDTTPSKPQQSGTGEGPLGSSPAQTATVNTTEVTAEDTNAEPASSGSSTEMPERTVPFDADDPIDGGEDDDPVPASGKSLFANLGKPVNKK